MANLITVEEYKEALGIIAPKDDLRISALITSVSKLVKTYCNCSIVDFYTTPKVEVKSIKPGINCLYLSEFPIKDIISIQVVDSGVSKTLGVSEFYLNRDTEGIYYTPVAHTASCWPVGLGNVTVTYTAGYETVPEDLKLAVIDIITYYLKDEHKPRQSLSGASKESVVSSSQMGSANFPDHIKRVLDLYRVL